MTSQAVVSYFYFSQAFSTFMQYMSMSHGYSTIGGIEGGRGCEDKTKKEKLSHQLGKLMGYGDAHQLIWMKVSRDCHAPDALEL